MLAVMSEVLIRPAVAEDVEFLTDMLIAASNAPHYRHTRAELLAEPETMHYIDGWPRPTDFGVVAVDESAEPVGAAWFRYFTAEDPAFGFISPDIPELAIGVTEPWRGRGVGRLLLRGLHDTARKTGIPRVCLSVDRENPALHLYQAEGYRWVRSGDHSDTMVLDL